VGLRAVKKRRFQFESLEGRAAPATLFVPGVTETIPPHTVQVGKDTYLVSATPETVNGVSGTLFVGTQE
jgi:hypothetical protein